MLHGALGRGHGGIFFRTGHIIILGRLGALVHQQEAHVGLVRASGGDAGIHINVVVQGNIVVSRCGGGHRLLTQPAVDPAVDQLAMEVVLVHDDVWVVHPIHPGGHVFFIVGVLAGDRIDQNGATDVLAAKEADGLIYSGADPVGRPVLVHLEVDVAE